MRMVTVMCQFQLLMVTATSVGGNCRFQWVVTVASYQQRKFYYKMYILKKTLVILYMFVKLIMMRPDFYFNWYRIQYYSRRHHNIL